MNAQTTRHRSMHMVKILISPDYGAGWSTWNSEHAEFMLKDPGLVELAERSATESEVEEYIKTKLADASVYLGGWKDIKVVEVEPGTQFRVHEYDGWESLVRRDEDSYFTT